MRVSVLIRPVVTTRTDGMHRFVGVSIRRPYFGKLEEVHVDNYLEEVEDADGTHFIVVLLYEPYVEACVRLYFALLNLAEQFPYIRFVRGVASDLLPSLVGPHRAYSCAPSLSLSLSLSLSPSLPLHVSGVLICYARVRFQTTQDEFGLPTLMIYRGGKQLHILVRVSDDIGVNFSDRDVVGLLAR